MINLFKKVFTTSYPGQPMQHKSLDLMSAAGTIDLTQIAGGKPMLSESAFYACVGDKARTIGQLPLQLYRKVDGANVLVHTGRMHRIFTQRPCAHMRMETFIEYLVSSLCITGGFYAYPLLNTRGNIMELVPFKSQRYAVSSNYRADGTVIYRWIENDGHTAKVGTLDAFLSVIEYTIDGLHPVNPLLLHNALIRSGITKQEDINTCSDNNIKETLIFSTDTGFKNINSVNRIKSELDNLKNPDSKTVTLLEEGVKPIPLKLTPAESKLLESADWTSKRVCSVLGVPPYRIGLAEIKNPKEIADLDEAYMRNQLNPIMVKIEKAISAFLPDDMFVRFNRKAYYSGSPWRLIASIDKEVKAGLTSINEGRVDLGREPVDGGDVFQIDTNNAAYGTWDNLTELQKMVYNNSKVGQDDNQE